MRTQKQIVAALLSTVLIALVGCSSEEDTPPTANIPGGQDGSSGSQAPDAVKPRVLNLPPDRYDHESPLDSPRETVVADANPLVVLKTSMGDITLKLDRTNAPLTVESFLAYVKDGFYQGTIFHQVDNGFILAAGGYTADLKAKPTRSQIRNEAHNGQKNLTGTVAMISLGGIDSATTQFLINLRDHPQFDHKTRDLPVPGEAHQYGFCVFGQLGNPDP